MFTHQDFSRRLFLRGTGACLALPYLESFAPANEVANKQRMVCVANPFGMVADAFFPTESGINAALPENLTEYDSLRGKFTVFSNFDHGINGGHSGTHAFLSGVRTQESATMPDGNVTLDQYLGEANAGQTRFPVLNTSAGSSRGGSVELSWTRSGVLVPAIQKVSQVFRLLFVDSDTEQANALSEKFDRQASILDTVMDRAKAMNWRLSQRDRNKLDQYLTSVREVEVAIQREQEWVHRPRPEVKVNEPEDGTVTEQLPILFNLIALALETDSTRVATIEVPGGFDTKGVGLEAKGYHAYSHHGKDPKLMAGQRKIERYQLDHLAKFIQKLDELELLNSTQVLFGSGMGDGSAHTNKNLPVLLAGGGYHHETHIVMPEPKEHRIPLSNLYLTMAQRFGVETDHFGHSTGTVSRLS
ncbi:DUF1552 domain-containing protein [Calycomorphotria hydatis]|uniref:DUF1552 domain-containing protein n=1 Tax=Calycomorphotria hydatis TaxID=2528027 RepID=A0A517T657_9PLAN|nr:DUF1552 domain-containing protein [Calycomorphotria hydatis]QDT63841.1 hypothetical protein V22_10660 [Calycomorphotria hydatis]